MSEQNNGHSLEEQRPRPFNPTEHLRKIKGDQDYLDVKWRLVWFRERYPHGTIETQELEYDLNREVEAETFVFNPETRRSEKVIKKAYGYARYRAVVEDGQGGRATGTKSENAANFPDFGEKAETGAIGRALAGLGFGTQFAPELNEADRIVDAPVERTPRTQGAPDSGNRKPAAQARPAAANGSGRTNSGAYKTAPTAVEAVSENYATEQQLTSIHKLCETLGKTEPQNPTSLTYTGAKELIQQLSREYRESHESRKAS